MKQKKGLWSKDFTFITIATCLTAIGGEALSLPVSLLVFDETGSAFCSSLIMVAGILPDMLLPVFIAPFIDKGEKKKWIVGLDLLMGILYAGVGIVAASREFSFIFYLTFVFVIGTISVFYRLSYNAWYPDLIPQGFEQKGYAVSGTVYPLIIIIMAPIAAFLYEKVTMSWIFLMVAGITLLAVLLESMIRETKNNTKNNEEKYNLKQYKEDILEGFQFIKKEKGIRNIYTYMSITSGCGDGITIVTQAYFQSNPLLSVTMFGFLKSSEMIGRLFGGIFQYNREIPADRRFQFTKFVYSVYDLMDAILLLIPYPFMIVNRFLCGVLGTNSATIREAAVQSYLPGNIRARINAFFQVIMAIGGILFQLIAGIMGQVLPYSLVAVGIGIFSLICMWFLIVHPGEVNGKVYGAVRKK